MRKGNVLGTILGFVCSLLMQGALVDAEACNDPEHTVKVCQGQYACNIVTPTSDVWVLHVDKEVCESLEEGEWGQIPDDLICQVAEMHLVKHPTCPTGCEEDLFTISWTLSQGCCEYKSELDCEPRKTQGPIGGH